VECVRRTLKNILFIIGMISLPWSADNELLFM
jgi:hypothetical protein